MRREPVRWVSGRALHGLWPGVEYAPIAYGEANSREGGEIGGWIAIQHDDVGQLPGRDGSFLLRYAEALGFVRSRSKNNFICCCAPVGRLPACPTLTYFNEAVDMPPLNAGVDFGGMRWRVACS